MAYVAPYLLSTETLNALPDGAFIVPVCTTRERFAKITNALWAGGFDDSELGSYDHLVDFLNAIPRIRAGCEYEPNEACNQIPLDSPLLSWYPESPFSPNETVPSGYNYHPYTVVTNSIIDQIVLQFGLGYQVGDVLTDFQKIPIGSSWSDLLGAQYLNFPRVRISGLEGAGVASIKLLSIPQGGRAFIVVDDIIHLTPQDNVFIELDMDLTSFPPETNIENTYSVTIESAGAHHIDVIFIPALDVTFIPLFFGGGIRSIELCGFGVSPMTTGCCDETNNLLRRQNELLTKLYEVVKGGFELKPIANMIVDSFPPSCVPFGYDSGIGDDETMPPKRAGALCWTIDKYVDAVLYQALREMLVPIGILETLVPDVANIPDDFKYLRVDLFAGVTLAGLVGAWTGGRDIVKCIMHTALAGQPNTFSIFRESVKSASNTDYVLRFLYIMIEQANNVPDNWKAFGRVLEFAASLPDIENFACPCPETGCVSADDIILVADSPDTTLEKLTSNTWRVISTYKKGDDPARPDATYAAIRDIYGRCVDFQAFSQSQSDGTMWDCSGNPAYSIGGQGGIGEKVEWRIWDGTTIDTVVTIDCVS